MAEADPAAGRGPRLNVLVMDDEAVVRNAVARGIERLGCDAERAGDGAEAIRLFMAAEHSGRPFDIVLLDLTVKGGMGGIECLQRLRELDPQVKAVASTGYAEEPVLARPGDFGFCAALPKPYSIGDLAETLHAFVRRRLR